MGPKSILQYSHQSVLFSAKPIGKGLSKRMVSKWLVFQSCAPAARIPKTRHFCTRLFWCPFGCLFKSTQSSSWKKGYLAKSFLQKAPAMLISPLIGCAQRLHESSARRWLVQSFGLWKWATRWKIPNCRTGMRTVQCRGGGVCSALCTSGVRRKLAAKFQTLPDIFRTFCFAVFHVQDVRNGISDTFPAFCRNLGIAEASLRDWWEGLGFGTLCGAAGVHFGRHTWAQLPEEAPQAARGEEREREKTKLYGFF